MLIQAQDSAVMLIDMQEKLLPLTIDATAIEKNCRWLLQIAQYLKIPIITTEQYPKGLGPTVTGLSEFCAPDQPLDKICFSSIGDEKITDKIRETDCEQWILIGIETHVCVLQTALELREYDKQVFVVEDCTTSRNQHDKRLALDRMKHHGVDIVTREMVVFEWLNKSGTPEFKHISGAFLK